jgi:hypothetical protein
MLTTLLLILGLVCFIFATVGWPKTAKVSFGWLGLAFWILVVLIGK